MNRGFTLIEMLVAFAIVAVLAGLIAVGANVLGRRGKAQKTLAIMGIIRQAVQSDPGHAVRLPGESPRGLELATYPTSPRGPWLEATNPVYRMRVDLLRVFILDDTWSRWRPVFDENLEELQRLKAVGTSKWNWIYSPWPQKAYQKGILDPWGNDIIAAPQGRLEEGAGFVLISAGPNLRFDDGPRDAAEATAAPLGSPDVLSGQRDIAGVTYTSDNLLDGNLREP